MLPDNESQFINLPSERTSHDYRHSVPSKIGFVPEVLTTLKQECQVKGLYDHPWKSYVGILQDKIKVKSDLVYCPMTGELIGYVNLKELCNQIKALENGIANTSCELATSSFVLMVRGGVLLICGFHLLHLQLTAWVPTSSMLFYGNMWNT